MSQVDSAAEEHTMHILDDEPIVRGLGRQVPAALGNLVATIVVLVGFVLFVWSLVATWSDNADKGLPLFQVIVAVTAVSLAAIYGRRTFSYIIALIGAAAWLFVSVLPLVSVAQVALQAVTVTIMLFGVAISVDATARSKRP